MPFNSKTRRRWFGALCLLAAIVMLGAGETVLKGRLSALGFVAYWVVCVVVTVLAIYAALLDARAVRQKIQDEKARKARSVAKPHNQSR